MAGVRVSVASTFDAISRSELADHLKLSEPEAEADVLDAVIQAAQIWLEHELGRSILSKTYYYTREAFPPGRRDMLLPWPDLVSVTSIAYTDTAGDPQTLSSTLYDVDTNAHTGRVRPVYSESWPSTRSSTMDAVRVTYVAGYASASAIPAPIKQAIKMLAADLWYSRENSTGANGPRYTVAMSAKALTSNYKAPGFGDL
jgi:uncharacterized phiE125 gp8 family phage protein